MNPWLHFVALPVLGAALSCASLTREEAQQAIEELQVASQAQALSSAAVEIGVDFSLGQGVERAAEEIRDFIASQMPCAESSLAGSQLTVRYGVRPGACIHRGQTYQGAHTITVSRGEGETIIVDHDWTNLENERIRLSGGATVTWSPTERTRHIVHDTQWLRLADGRTGEGRGDHIQSALASGLADGFAVEGEREWRGKSGQWNLTMAGVEMRWVDPVPQAGEYALVAPEGDELRVNFSRTASTRIRVSIEGPRRSFDFDIDTRN